MTEPSVPTASAPRPTSTTPSTFLFTDIEGSTRLWEEHAAAMGVALAQHDRLLRGAIESNGGAVIKTTGDGILAIFGTAQGALEAALAGQRALRDASWGETGPLRVRMALHSGTAESRDGDYFGPALNRVARILGIGHGGQVLCSAVAAILAGDALPAGTGLRDLGSHRLRDLDRPEQVFQVEAPDLPREFPPLRSQTTRRSNLPVQLTSFVGRERELDEVAQLLGRHRLVTVVGVGGTGKTRLVLEAAARVADRFDDGAWLAELAPLTDPAQLPAEVARALGVSEVPGVPTLGVIAAFLADKQLLLILDNAEHLVDGTASLAERLLAAAPGLRVLATSREALAVAGEAVLQLRSLSCPTVPNRGGFADDEPDLEAAAGTEAVRLFADRAATVDPGFSVSPTNIGSVSEICRRLDGIPLAIELAAARVTAMSPDEIAQGLGDRFRLLAGGRRTAVPRQQTLHALIDWSWELLTEDDRRLLRRLSVFVGGWTVAMAARVVGDEAGVIDRVDLLDGLQRLVDRSLVVVDRGTTTRFRMLETIRQYARERLIEAGEAAAVADRHLAAFAGLAEDATVPLRGPEMVDWLDRLDADQENLTAALEWGLEASPWEAVKMTWPLLGYWSVRVMSRDNDARIEAAIEIARRMVVENPDATPADQAIAARLLGEAARLWAMSGRATVAMPWAEDALKMAAASGDPVARLYALGGRAIAGVFTGAAGATDAQLRAYFEEGVTLGEATGEWWIVGMAAAFFGSAMTRFDPERSIDFVRRGNEAARRSGSPYVLAAVAIATGRALGTRGDVEASSASFAEAVRRFQELGDDRFVLAARSDLAHMYRRNGRLAEALAIYRETISGWVYFGHRGAIANQLENVAFVEAASGDLAVAARLLGAAAAMRASANAPMAFDETPEYEAELAQVRAGLGAAFDAEWSAGQAMSPKAAVELARSRGAET